MKNIISIIMASLILATTLSSCERDILKGEGARADVSRNTEPFHAIEISGNRHVEIVPSSAHKVKLTGYANLIDVLDSYVVDGELKFSYPHHTAVRNDNVKLQIHMPSLRGLRLSGSPQIKVRQGFPEADEMRISMSGDGQLSFDGGSVVKLQLESSGDAKVYARSLLAEKAKVSISGENHIELSALQKLEVIISGSGEVHYWGNPLVSAMISGSGKTVRH